MAQSMFRYLEFGPLELHVQVEGPSEAGIQAHIEHVTKRMRARSLMSPGLRYAYVVQDSEREFPGANAAQRKLLAEWIARDAELITSTCLGVSFVIPSAIVRGALTAVFWLSRMPAPHRVHASLEEALTVAIREVTLAGREVAPSVREQVLMALRKDKGQRVSAG